MEEEVYLQLPWQPQPWWVEEVLLDNESFKIEARWNETQNFWSFDLLTNADIPIFVGFKVVIGIDYLKRLVNPAKPDGRLLFVGNNSRSHVPQFGDIPSRARLLYVR